MTSLWRHHTIYYMMTSWWRHNATSGWIQTQHQTFSNSQDNILSTKTGNADYPRVAHRIFGIVHKAPHYFGYTYQSHPWLIYICLFDYWNELPGIRTPVPLVRWHMCYHCTMSTDTSIKVWPLSFCTIVPLDQESMCYHTKGMSSKPPTADNYLPLWVDRHGVMATPLSALDIPLHSIHLSIYLTFI